MKTWWQKGKMTYYEQFLILPLRFLETSAAEESESVCLRERNYLLVISPVFNSTRFYITNDLLYIVEILKTECAD